MKRFENRHIGITNSETDLMLSALGMNNINDLLFKTVPDNIRMKDELELPNPMTEYEYLNYIKEVASENKVFKSFIGQGYYGTVLPPVIQRNILENPGWYTQYTPYQAEISQGRLEALLNFQTMVSELTALPISNSSLLDEATAAAEAMWMMYDQHNKKRKKNPALKLFVDKYTFSQTKQVLETRAEAKGITIEYGNYFDFEPNDEYFGVIVQYPNSIGDVLDYSGIIHDAKSKNILVTFIADILSLTLLTPPGELGADIAVGSTQRFGVPMGFGGPHAAYFAAKEDFKRKMPGRIIGVSLDRNGKNAYRMALQTREQHIKREKATSNICTAQALLAIMAGFYSIYHGKDGLIEIAKTVFNNTSKLENSLRNLGFNTINSSYFDTLTYNVTAEELKIIKEYTVKKNINLFYQDNQISISIDELTSVNEIKIIIIEAFAKSKNQTVEYIESTDDLKSILPDSLIRNSDFMTHDIFNKFRSETELMRYMKRLENRDISLVHSMISLGSCTMKLNAAVEMIPVTWPEFTEIHPFAPKNQVKGYTKLIDELASYLNEITGFEACTFQPNSGAQGEFTGLMAIRAFHRDNGNNQRTVILVPSSAHGTNPASAVMAGMDVVIVSSDDKGNIDVEDLRQKADKYANNLAGFMVTYPSTHGVFEKEIVEMCEIIHKKGGLVYMDGANMNAQIGLTKPSIIGADICHLNLHKTFAIPHGGGGPGVGPVLANNKLSAYLPDHVFEKNGKKAIKAVSSAYNGSAGILMISHAYIRLMGAIGLKKSTEAAILNANYLKVRLAEKYNIVYTNSMGMVAHEMILDLRDFKKQGVSAEDVAKRLMDYGFHAPTVSFPVHDTFMIEPTESEGKDEIDRFVDAMFKIRKEIDDVINGKVNKENNLLKNAPHTAEMVTADNWEFDYSRKEAAYPLDYLKDTFKYWPFVARIDNAYGDRHLYCTCPPTEMYEDNNIEKIKF